MTKRKLLKTLEMYSYVLNCAIDEEKRKGETEGFYDYLLGRYFAVQEVANMLKYKEYYNFINDKLTERMKEDL